jgi:hypothetical protein
MLVCPQTEPSDIDRLVLSLSQIIDELRNA